MESHRSALALVRHLSFQTQNIPELALERLEVGVDRLRRISSSRATSATNSLLFAGPLFCLTNRKTLADDFTRQGIGIRSSGNGPRVAHADIAIQ